MASVLEWLGRKLVKEEASESSKLTGGKMFVKTFNLVEMDDVNEVLEYLKIGTTITLLKIKNKNLAFHSVKKIKEVCEQVGGEVVGLSDSWFLAVPNDVDIIKKSAKDGFIEHIANETQKEPPKEAVGGKDVFEDFQDFRMKQEKESPDIREFASEKKEE